MTRRQGKITLLLVRHGEPGSKGLGRLTAQGREQARRLGQWLAAHYQIEALYASPVTRTRETAQIVNQHLRVPLITKKGLKGLGGEVKLREFLPKSDGAFMVDSSSHSGWAMQSDYMRLYKRVSKTLVEILRSSRASTILLVSHSDVIGTLIRSLFGNHSVTFDSDFTGVSSLSWNGGRWEVAYLNRLDHLNE